MEIPRNYNKKKARKLNETFSVLEYQNFRINFCILPFLRKEISREFP